MRQCRQMKKNTSDENDVQLALVQDSHSPELGNARTPTNKSDDLNLETQLPVMDDDHFTLLMLLSQTHVTPGWCQW